MPEFTSPIDDLKVASPCSANWDEMYGDERKRYCAGCKLNVYNLSGMTRSEADTLVLRAEGRLCVRFYRRADGSVITRDCPVGWARVKKRVRVMGTAAISLIMTIFTGVFFASLFSKRPGSTVPLIGETMGAIRVSPKSYPTMGNIAVPPPKANGPTKRS